MTAQTAWSGVESVLPQTADIVRRRWHVSSVPEPDSCTAANISASFEHCVGAQEKRFWNREAHGLRSLEIDGQLEFRGLLYEYVFRLTAP
jgi:hypothetical protein